MEFGEKAAKYIDIRNIVQFSTANCTNHKSEELYILFWKMTEAIRFYSILVVIVISILLLQKYVLIPTLVHPVSASLQKRDIIYYNTASEGMIWEKR